MNVTKMILAFGLAGSVAFPAARLGGMVYRYGLHGACVRVPGLRVEVSGSGQTTTTDSTGSWVFDYYDNVGILNNPKKADHLGGRQFVMENGRLVLRLQGYDPLGNRKPISGQKSFGSRTQASPSITGFDTMIYSRDGRNPRIQPFPCNNISVFSISFRYDTLDRGEGTLVDSRDGQTYPTVKIGNQTWMAKNLNFKVDSSWWYLGEACWSIPTANGSFLTCDSIDGSSRQIPTSDRIYDYGLLYTWNAAVGLTDSCKGMTCLIAGTDSGTPKSIKGLCPIGWHLPSKSEWIELKRTVAKDPIVGAKYVGTALAGGTWMLGGPAVRTREAWNYFGFDARPGGFRSSSKFFDGLIKSYWWSSTEVDSSKSWSANSTAGIVDNGSYPWSEGILDTLHSKKDLGYSVRCVKD